MAKRTPVPRVKLRSVDGPRIGDSRRALTDDALRSLAEDPDMQALVLTLGHTAQLTDSGATPTEWEALTAALVAEHTPEQLANMLTGAAALIARTGGAA